MRRNFAQILKEASIDIKEEYAKLYGMMYSRSIQISDRKRISAHDEIGDAFCNFHFRGTCLSLEEFDSKHGFTFVENPTDFTIDTLVSLCEYIYNMMVAYQCSGLYGFMQSPINTQFYLQQIDIVIEAIGYMRTQQDNFTIFVEKSPVAISVAEIVPQEISYKVISYNHYSMKGNIQAKRETLRLLANLLEPQRKELESIDKAFTSDLFFAFNNFTIRHNNSDPADTAKYKKVVAELPDEQLETVYDEVYQMCLLAFLRLDYNKNKSLIDTIKSGM